MSLYTLVYESASTQATSDNLPDEIENILAKARARNPGLGISGALLVTEGRFVQALEGDEKAVHALFDRIALDRRHRHVGILCARASAKRHFAEWSMAFIGDTGALRRRYADRPLASLVDQRSGDTLIDFMREIALSGDE